MIRNPRPDLAQVSQIDWARLAAYIDGEGCIRIAGVKGLRSKSRRVLYVEVSIANTDVRLGQWLKATFGGSTYVSNRKAVARNPHWAPAVAWVVGSRHAATILEYCQLYFLLKREQADVALAFQSTIITDRRYGRTGRPQAVLDHQQDLKSQLQALKGTSSRARRTTVAGATIQ